MCRFLLTQSSSEFPPQRYLEKFADMAEKSRTFDGDKHEDGWGISWLDHKNTWQRRTSLKPVWKDRETFSKVPSSTIFTVHARSASFADQKGVLEYNQPYINDAYSFVFNGFLKGVKLPSSIPGEIGAQKIWSLLQNFLQNNDPQTSLEKVKHVLIKNSEEIQALNIGLANKDTIYSLNYFTKYPDKYQLHYFSDKNVKIICSEPLDFML